MIFNGFTNFQPGYGSAGINFCKLELTPASDHFLSHDFFDGAADALLSHPRVLLSRRFPAGRLPAMLSRRRFSAASRFTSRTRPGRFPRGKNASWSLPTAASTAGRIPPSRRCRPPPGPMTCRMPSHLSVFSQNPG